MNDQNDPQRVLINQSYSVWRLVTSKVLEGFVLGLVVFNIFFNSFKEATEFSLIKYADDAKFGGTGSAQWQGYHPKGPGQVGRTG